MGRGGLGALEFDKEIVHSIDLDGPSLQSGPHGLVHGTPVACLFPWVGFERGLRPYHDMFGDGSFGKIMVGMRDRKMIGLTLNEKRTKFFRFV